MPAPCRLGGSATLARVHRILAARGLDPDALPEVDDRDHDGPGDPDWHQRHRARVALARWEAATPPRYRESASCTDPRVTAWADRAATAPVTAGALLLTGPTGTSKTHQAYGALRHIAASGPSRFEMHATNSADMYGSLRPSGTPGSSEEELRRLARVPLLLLDDVGSAKASEWTEEVTYRIVDYRYNHCLLSVFTSNLPARSAHGLDLRTTLGERITSRLAEMTTVVPVLGEDRRLQRVAS